MSLSDAYFSGTSLNLTDRILIVVKGTNNGASSSTLTLFTEGSQYYSYATTTFGSSSSSSSPFTGGTVSGATNFTGGVTANTLTVSAATDPVKFVGLQSTLTDTSILSVDGAGVVHTISNFNGIYWNNATTATTATANNGYIGTATTLTTITLPSTAPIGTIVEIVGTGTGLWRISQTGSQIIKFGTTGTTAGSSGYLSATSQYDCVKLLCTSTNTTFVVTSAIGNIFYI